VRSSKFSRSEQARTAACVGHRDSIEFESWGVGNRDSVAYEGSPLSCRVGCNVVLARSSGVTMPCMGCPAASRACIEH
jgi:hypothetical protein